MHHLSIFQLFWIAFWILCLGAIYMMGAKFFYPDLKIIAKAVRSEYSSRRQRKRAAQELEAHFQLPSAEARNTPAERS